MRTSVVTRLTRNVKPTMNPCHSPAQKPAGGAPATLYWEPGPATARKLGIGHLGGGCCSLIERRRSATARLFLRHRGAGMRQGDLAHWAAPAPVGLFGSTLLLS